MKLKWIAVGLLLVLALPGRAAAPAGRYTVNTLTVADNFTGLTWQRGTGPAPVMWAAALSYCNNLPLAGSGWRVPTEKELLTLVDETAGAPTIDSAFTGTPSGAMWSSTPYHPSPNAVWMVYFDDGHAEAHANDSMIGVRCVR